MGYSELRKTKLGTKKFGTIQYLGKLDRTVKNHTKKQKEEHVIMCKIRETERRRFIKYKLRSVIYKALSNLRKYRLVNRTSNNSFLSLSRRKSWSYVHRVNGEMLTNDFYETIKTMKSSKATMQYVRRLKRNKYYKQL